MSGISPVHSAFPQEVVTEPEPSMSAQPPQGNAPPGGNLPPAYAPPQGNAPPAGGVPAYTSNAGPGETVVPYSQQLPASHTSANPGAASSVQLTEPTSRMRRMLSRVSLRTQASNTSLGSQPGRPGGATPPPPVPPLPQSVRGAQTSAAPGGSGANAPQPEAGPSSGISPQKQAERNHKLRQAAEKGDREGITRRLDKGANPVAPSSIQGQNTFHKLALSGKNRSATIEQVINSTNAASLGQAAIARDRNGNTPVHLAQQALGKAEGANNTDGQRRSRLLRDQLTAAATENGHDVNAITNNAGKTPQQMRNEARTEAERARQNAANLGDDLRAANLV